MKALTLTEVSRFVFGETEDLDSKPGERLIDVSACGICGSDMHAFLGHDPRRPTPVVLGHEISGTDRDTNQRVTLNPLVACGHCPACLSGREHLCPDRQLLSMPPRPGGFAQVVRVPVANIHPIPDGLSFNAAALAEPLAVCWHAVHLAEEASRHPLDQANCLVIGGGAIGLGSALCLLAFGASDVTVHEPNPIRAEVLTGIPGLRVVTEAEPVGTSQVVIDAVGYAATRAAASAHAAPGGVIVHIGLGEDTGGIDVRRLTLQEISFIGSYCYTDRDFRETLEAMGTGQLGALDWFETRPLSDGQAAFDAIRAGQVAAPKIILHP